MKKVLFIIVVVFMTSVNFAQAQGVAINTTGADPDSSAILDVSGATGGILIPRMTTEQRNQISSPATSLLVYNIDVQVFEYWNGVAWNTLALDTGSENLIQITVDIPELDNGEFWETSICIAGLTSTSIVDIVPTCNLNDSNGNVIISWWIDVTTGTVWIRFTNQSHHENSDVCDATLNLWVKNQ